MLQKNKKIKEKRNSIDEPEFLSPSAYPSWTKLFNYCHLD